MMQTDRSNPAAAAGRPRQNPSESTLAALSPTAVAEQLERILSSKSFRQAERLRRFLGYVVKQALEEETASLKEYSIAVEVFDKPESFDPRVDPIVRVEAGRLRAKIREYYDTEGCNDPLWVGLRSRGYRPLFKPRKVTNASRESVAGVAENGHSTGTSAKARLIAVLPFVDLSPDQRHQYLCDALAQQIINGVSKIDGLRVVGWTTACQFKERATDIREIGRALDVGVVLEGSVQQVDRRVRVSAQLLSASDGFDLWAETYDRLVENVFAVQDEITRKVVDALKATLLDGRVRMPGGTAEPTNQPPALI